MCDSLINPKILHASKGHWEGDGSEICKVSKSKPSICVNYSLKYFKVDYLRGRRSKRRNGGWYHTPIKFEWIPPLDKSIEKLENYQLIDQYSN